MDGNYVLDANELSTRFADFGFRDEDVEHIMLMLGVPLLAARHCNKWT